MGFCIYCNQNVYSNTTCPKCYRTIKTSTANKSDGPSRVTSMFPDQKRLNTNTDKWQDTYGKKAIFNNGLSSAAPIRPRQQRIMPQFTTSTSTQQQQQQKNYGYKAPQSPAPESSSVSTPILSSLAGSRSTLTSSANKTNAYFQYQRTRRASMFNRTNLPEEEQASGPAPTSTVSTSAIVTSPVPTPPKSPVLNKISEESVSTAKSSFNYRRERAASSPGQQPEEHATVPKAFIASSIIAPSAATPVTAAPIAASAPIANEPKKTESTPRRRKVVKKPCKECGQHVSKKDYRGLKIHTGEVLIFHTYCLFCAKCHQNFNGLEFCTDGKNFYHTECPDHTTILNDHHAANSSRQGSPLSEEEEPYPQTPPPASHNTHFDIVSSSPTDMVSPYTENELPKKQDVIVPDSTAVMCNTCTLPVTDSTCLELANYFYHKECLLCAGCNKTVPTDRKLSKYQDKLYCDHCAPTNNTNNKINILKSKSTTTTGIRINVDNSVPKRAPTITTPSDIFKSRKKVLPRLGGVRSCARCNQSMPFSDTQPGPNASRWHKKCLRCTGCKKQMDSDAHMTVDEETGLCSVHCRECLDETPKPRFVR